MAILSLWFFLLQISSASTDCRLKKPIPVSENKESWVIEKPRFYPLFRTGSLIENYNEQPMVLDIFGIAIGEDATPWWGAAFRRADRNPWWSRVGLSMSYGPGMYVRGSVDVAGNRVTYHTFAGTAKRSDPMSMYNEVQIVIENNQIISLSLTVPVTEPCEVDGNQAWCPWIGEHETSCLVSGALN
jgi:hypothetical protein